MSLEYIRTHYGVPAEIGRRIEYTGDKSGTPKQGVIVGDAGQYLHLHFDGEPKPVKPYHPTWELRYLPETGPVPKVRVTRSQQRYQRYLEIGECFANFKQFLGYEADERAAQRLGYGSVNEYWRRTSALA